MTGDPGTASLLMSLRGQGVQNMPLLRALELTPRDIFFPHADPASLYADVSLPLPCAQTSLSPYILARMIDALAPAADHRVLEIGTGSGYQTAVLARLVRRVYTIERHRALSLAAQECFARLALHNIAPRIADGLPGWPEQAPFERIIATVALPTLPLTLAAQLKVGGVLVAAVAVPVQRLLRIERASDNLIRTVLEDNTSLPMIEEGSAYRRRADRQDA